MFPLEQRYCSEWEYLASICHMTRVSFRSRGSTYMRGRADFTLPTYSSYDL
jgi:hypothetical protein